MTSPARQWLNITPHKISLAILINTYVNDPELDNQTKSEVGWLLIDEITVGIQRKYYVYIILIIFIA